MWQKRYVLLFLVLMDCGNKDELVLVPKLVIFFAQTNCYAAKQLSNIND